MADARTSADSAASTHTPGSPIAGAAPEHFDLAELAPDVVSPSGTRTWIVRGQNVVVAHVAPVDGDPLGVTDLRTEQMVLLLHEDSAAEFRSGQDSRVVRGAAVVIVPPGPADVVPLGRGHLVRLVEAAERSWADRARNASSYERPHPHVTPLRSRPAPVGGDRLRVYGLDDSPPSPTRFGTIFRSRAFMVNFLHPVDGRRDPRQLSPHHHDDVEQLSLAVEGAFVHHIRIPWEADSTAWRDDEHQRMGSPSLSIIPPRAIHTSEAAGDGRNRLLDVFAPPRADLSAMPGWVLNAEDYPPQQRPEGQEE